MRYAVVFEKGRSGYGAYVPDLPGCVAVGKSLRRVQRLIREAIELHIEALREDGESVPSPSSTLEYVQVSASARRALGSQHQSRRTGSR